MTNTTPAIAHIRRPGPLCLLVDQGRVNCQHFGLCSGGAVDAYAYSWANKLLGNKPAAAALEITLGPAEIHFEQNTQIALCGAKNSATLNNKALIPWSSHRIHAGDTLKIAMAKSGLRSYLSIKGGFIATPYFGSRAPLSEHGTEIPLTKGERLYYAEDDAKDSTHKTAHWQAIPSYQKELTLCLYPCYQYSAFSAAAINTLQNSSYAISAQSNRMAYCLKGQEVVWGKTDIVSEGIAFGSVQIPPNGQPIVLLTDRQTIGGYPKIGCVKADDCYALAQRRPGQYVRFNFISFNDEPH